MTNTKTFLPLFQDAYSAMNALAKQAEKENSSFRFKVNMALGTMNDIQKTIDECIGMDIANDYPYVVRQTQEKN